jgi:tol-pal system protein YbgF
MIGHKTTQAAIFLMAALFLFGGCATKKDIMRLETKTDYIQSDQRQMKETVQRLDSLINSDSQASRQLRAEIRSAVNDLIEQFQIMQANMNDLQDKVNLIVQGQSGRTQVIMPPKLPDSSKDSSGVISPPPGVDCQVLYDDAFVNIRRGQYEDAAKGFGDYLKFCSTQELVPDAYYWLGESYYSLERYKEAIIEFDKVVKDFPNSKKRSAAMFKMARCNEELGQKKDAKSIYNKIISDYPNTLEASQAKERLKELK